MPSLSKISEQARVWYILKGYIIEECGRGPVLGSIRRFWFDGKLHREDGPAYEATGYSSWYTHGVYQHTARHRPQRGPTFR